MRVVALSVDARATSNETAHNVEAAAEAAKAPTVDEEAAETETLADVAITAALTVAATAVHALLIAVTGGVETTAEEDEVAVQALLDLEAQDPLKTETQAGHAVAHRDIARSLQDRVQAHMTLTNAQLVTTRLSRATAATSTATAITVRSKRTQ